MGGSMKKLAIGLSLILLFSLGLGSGYFWALTTISDPFGSAGLVASGLQEFARKKAAADRKRYREHQAELKALEEQREAEVQTANKERQRAERRLKSVSKRYLVQIQELEEKVTVYDRQIEDLEPVVLEQIKDAPEPVQANFFQLKKAYTSKIDALTLENDVLKDLLKKTQEVNIKLGQENIALWKQVDAARSRYKHAEARVQELDGARFRWGPGVAGPLIRTGIPEHPWTWGVAAGIAFMWG